MPQAISDDELKDLERRARAALRAEPPILTAVEGAAKRYELQAGAEVIDFVREVGPPAVLRLVEEVRRLRADQEKLIERLRKVETWSTET